MVSCIHKLIGGADEESLECLCTLLRTIGGQLEEECQKRGKVKEHLEPYFNRLKGVVQSKQTSSRVRFMIQDVLDMRSKGWKLRSIQDTGPKTIDQIHKEVKQEELRNAMDHQQHRDRKGKGGGRDEPPQSYGRRSQTGPIHQNTGPIDFGFLKNLRVCLSSVCFPIFAIR